MSLSYSKQKQLLEESISSGRKLSDLLTEKGLTYDDLVYGINVYDNVNIAVDNSIEQIEAIPATIPAVSFFSGAGGLDIGFELAGFNNLISIEFNEIFCRTLRTNWPNKIVLGPPFSEGDLSKRNEIAALLRFHGIVENFPGVFHGGPPCQSFSVASCQRFTKDSDKFKRKGFDDKEKGTLIFDYIWYIKTFRPMAFLIENVSGILGFDTEGKVQAALDELTTLGYHITLPQVVNAAYYGVPQNRRRWIVMGTRGNRQIEFPRPNMTPTPCGPTLLRPLTGCNNHITREHTAESVLRYMILDYGCRDHLGRVDRLDPNLPSKTVIAGGTKGGGRSHLHPLHPRTLSVRECARLQTFPDWFTFTGANARQFTQVGNAVPPLLAYKLAMAMRTALIDL
ncbi:MAG: DNA cytosine methyltransferase [Lachnoclostridium sp.]|nr:DNA cytosine methyltransferase [Lachnoclostridium sp.]